MDGYFIDGIKFDVGLEDPRPWGGRCRIPKGWKKLTRPKPECGYCHYSNENSQGALICETVGFPDAYNPETEDVWCAYSDRISSWDSKRFARACKLAGSGEQNWSSCLLGKSDEKLKKFAMVALNLRLIPKHVQIVHHFNVSNGYSCPTVLAIFDKEKEKAAKEKKEAKISKKNSNN